MHIRHKSKVNISPSTYHQIVEEIERDPLIRRTTVYAAFLTSAICVLTGLLMWYVLLHPAKLVHTSGTVTAINSGKTDVQGTVTTFIAFDFKTADGQAKSVKAPVTNGHVYETGDALTIGYSPLNPNYARNLSHINPPRVSVLLWTAPFIIAVWFGFVALFRHHARQMEIWDAAEAANIREGEEGA